MILAISKQRTVVVVGFCYCCYSAETLLELTFVRIVLDQHPSKFKSLEILLNEWALVASQMAVTEDETLFVVESNINWRENEQLKYKRNLCLDNRQLHVTERVCFRESIRVCRKQICHDSYVFAVAVMVLVLSALAMQKINKTARMRWESKTSGRWRHERFPQRFHVEM